MMASSSQGAAHSTDPVGTGDYVVKPGDCLSSIAEKHGLTWGKIWDYPANRDFTVHRGDPNALLPGDCLTIPQLQERTESGGTEQRHGFRRKGTPARLRVRLLEWGQPRANLDFSLTVEGQIISGTTDSDGRIEISIPPNSIEGELKVTEGGEIRTYRLALGHVDPADSVSGAQVRLRNLGYDPGPVDNQMGPCTRTALRAFQKNQDLSVTGQCDATTCDRLKEAYGG